MQRDARKGASQSVLTAEFRGLTVSSYFQPIFSVSHRRPVGYEGLVRAYNHQGELISPLSLLAMPTDGHERLMLDRVCRHLHMHNFALQENGEAWLFLNLNSQCLVEQRPDEGFMQALFTQTLIPPHRVVIEILESEIHDRQYLKELIEHFRQLGCLIAIDDFGAGHSNFDRIWELAPDIVKVDRSLVYSAGHSSRVERILTGIVSLIHEAGSLVVIEGIENETEALVSMAANADMVQGFYFGKPQPAITVEANSVSNIDDLLSTQKNKRFKNSHQTNQSFKKIETLFHHAMTAFALNSHFEHSTEILFSEHRAVRCYLLDGAGYQMARNVYSPHYQQQMDPRFTPLLSGDNANWSHKHYHFSCVGKPRENAGEPTLSVSGGLTHVYYLVANRSGGR